jgi:hypothetical protein
MADGKANQALTTPDDRKNFLRDIFISILLFSSISQRALQAETQIGANLLVTY